MPWIILHLWGFFMYQGCRTQRWQNHWNRRRLHTGYFVLSYAIFTSSESSWVSFKSSSQTFLQCQMAVTLDKPGAAHMSKIISPGQGPSTCPTTTEGKFWRNSKCGRTPLREGQLYRGNLIWIATPLKTKKYDSSGHMQYSLLLYVWTYLNNEIKSKSGRVLPIV